MTLWRLGPDYPLWDVGLIPPFNESGLKKPPMNEKSSEEKESRLLR